MLGYFTLSVSAQVLFAALNKTYFTAHPLLYNYTEIVSKSKASVKRLYRIHTSQGMDVNWNENLGLRVELHMICGTHVLLLPVGHSYQLGLQCLGLHTEKNLVILLLAFMNTVHLNRTRLT